VFPVEAAGGSDLIVGDDGVARCRWGSAPEIYRAYHDSEWGLPVDDDHRLFEKLCLEGFQAGLSWLTILRKREHFRAAFDDFDFERVARYGKRDVTRLLADAGIVRHRGKIEATINTAQRALEMVEAEGSLGSYIWRFEPDADSKALARDLKRRGWRFVGPTTVYAFMQAMGLVNDHVDGCEFRPVVQQARSRFLGSSQPRA
jgi:DNA-3-methyladenine glycosylase I